MTEKRRILLADHAHQAIYPILNSAPKHYHLETVDAGRECLKKIHEFKPELILIDLMLPEMHAIEILKHLKQDEETRSIGVIVSSFQAMVQNYHSALDAGANYFLLKPIDPKEFFELADRFFKGELTPAPFMIKGEPNANTATCYHPVPSMITSYLRFWGTRGSNPVSGPNSVRYGGNTSCLEVRHNEDMIIVDAGTGIRELGDVINVNDEKNIHLFIGHTHWDHITGFPFFSPLYKKNTSITIWAPVGFEESTKELLTNMLRYAYFPVQLEEMHAKVTFKELRDHHPVHIGNITIESRYTTHPGPTLCFKFKAGQTTIGYVTDNEVLFGYHGHPNDIHRDHPLLQPDIELIEFFRDCDILIHEAQYFPREYINKVGWGHSSIPNATVFVKHVGCSQWIATHHDPLHRDEDLRIKTQLHLDVLKDCNFHCNFQMAYDGLVIPI